MSDPATTDPYADQRGARVFRWIGALAVFGIVIVALAILAFEAVGDAVVFVGDGVDTPAAETEAEPTETADAEDGGEDDAATSDDGAGPGGAGTYEVQPGDTGSSIARDIYGSQAAWEEIAAYNDLDPTVTLNVGQQLNLPPR